MLFVEEFGSTKLFILKVKRGGEFISYHFTLIIITNQVQPNKPTKPKTKSNHNACMVQISLRNPQTQPKISNYFCRVSTSLVHYRLLW